jgi:biopolymer transport protein ExbD
MKQILLMIVMVALVGLVGCGKKEPELSTKKVITPDEAANKLFVEATKLISQAKAKEDSDIKSAIAGYKKALDNLRKIINEYPESGLAVKLVSNETIFTGHSMAQLESHAQELLGTVEEETRRAEAIKKNLLNIYITSSDNITVGGKKTSLSKLRVELKKRVEANPTLNLSIESENDTHTMEQVLNIARSLGIKIVKATVSLYNN